MPLERMLTTCKSALRLGLAYSELIQIGQMCKRLLDAGRMRRLEELGYHAELVVRVEHVHSVTWTVLVHFLEFDLIHPPRRSTRHPP